MFKLNITEFKMNELHDLRDFSDALVANSSVKWDSFCGKCIAANREDSGKMVCLDKQNPDLIFGTNNEYFEHQNYFILRSRFIGMLDEYLSFPTIHDPNLSDTTIYIHLKKGSDVISKSVYFDLNHSNSSSFFPTEPNLFTQEDVGKTYRIYMGPLATPPQWL